MRTRSIIAAATCLLAGVIGAQAIGTKPVDGSPLRIVRQDYREFCGSALYTWNLTAGTLKSVTGKCAPNLNDPPDTKIEKISVPELKRLRLAANKALVSGVIDERCMTATPGTYVQVGSGPRSFYVERGSKKAQSPGIPHCLNEAGRTLVREMTASLGQAKR